MRLGTTPKHTFTFPFETDLIQELKITYSQNKKIILEKYLSDCEVDKNSVSYKLTQEETFLFANGDYFYFALRDIEVVKNLDVRGEFI